MPQRVVDPFLLLAIAEGCDEAPVEALLQPDLDPEQLLREPPSDLPPRVLRRLGDPGLRTRAEAMQAQATVLGLHVLTPSHPQYPARLQEAPLRPLLLFARGNVAALHEQRLHVAVVGSRTPTPYGRAAATDFAGALARAGVVLWSGLARGIDAEAHGQSVLSKVPGVAVLAGGLDAIYPPEHGKLAADLVASSGCLLSEAPPGLVARRGHFPRRNRILAGACTAVLVVEAGLGSGSLITARCGADAGATVFAVPGPYGSERSRGCHRLIADGGQIAVEPAELLRELGLQPAPSGEVALQLQCSADEQALLSALQSGPRPSDLAMRESGLERATFLRALMSLRTRGQVRVMPGDLLALGNAPR